MDKITKTDNETPNAQWAGWALRHAWNGGDHSPELGTLLSDRLGALEHGPRSFLVATSCGHWGRGEILMQAAQAARDAGANRSSKAQAWLVLNDSAPFVDQMGAANAASGAMLCRLGSVGTIGSLLKV